MKKLYLIILTALCALSCNKSTKNEIEFWTLQLSPTFNTYFQNIIKEYERQNPNVKIKWVDVPYDAAIQKLMSSVAAGNPPDVVNLSADFLAKFSGLKALANLREYLPDSVFLSYLPNSLQLCKYEDKVVALPWYLNTYVVLYNKQLLQQANFKTSDVPKTFNDLLKFIKTYKDRTAKFAFFWNIGKESYLPMMLGSEGIPMIDSSMTKAFFNSDECVKCIDKWIELYKTGYLPKECIIKPGSEVIESYQSGQSVIVFTGPVFIKRIKENAPSVFNSTEVSASLVGKTGKHELAEMCLSVLNTSRNKEQAAKFAAFVTNSQNQLSFCKLAVIYPSTLEALKDSYFTKDTGDLESTARILGARELFSATQLRSFLLHPKFDLLRDSFDEAIQDAALGKTSTKQALNRAVKEWDEILKEDL